MTQRSECTWMLCYTQACIFFVMWGFIEYYVTHRPALPVLCEVSLNMILHKGLHFLCCVRFQWLLCYTQAYISFVVWGFTKYYVTHRPTFPLLCEVSLNIMLHTGLHFLSYVRFHWILCYTQSYISCVMLGFTEYYVTHRPTFPVLCEVSLNIMLHTGLHFLCCVRFHWILCYTRAYISCVMWGFTEYYVTHRPKFPSLCEVLLNIMLHTGLHFLCYVRFHWILCYTQAYISCVMWGSTEYYVTHRPTFPVLCEISLNIMLHTGLHFLCYVRFHWLGYFHHDVGKHILSDMVLNNHIYFWYLFSSL
jgi:hypothetical protein